MSNGAESKMSDGEITQDLNLGGVVKYRYRVRPLGHRYALNTTSFRRVDEYGAEVVDSWTGDIMTAHWAASQELALLVAETQAAERNAPMVALEFASHLALFLDRSRGLTGDGDVEEGEILEDLDKILEWHLGMIRGLKVEPLDMTKLHVQAPEFNA